MQFNFNHTRTHYIWVIIFYLSVGLSVIFAPLSSLAVTVQEIPNPRDQSGDWVTDMAGILSEDTQAQINQMISDLEAKNGTEMAVVTVPSTSSAASPKDFATELFNYWGIGKAGEDNGVLFLISVGDRRVEIETGYGVEGILPDARVGNIIDTKIIPKFKQGDFEGGILAGTKALVIVLASEPDTVGIVLRARVTADEPTFISLLLGTVVLVGIVVLTGYVFYLLSRPEKIFLQPEGYTRRKQGNHIFSCADCQQPMAKVDSSLFESSLTLQQKAAQNLGSVKFEGWNCLQCNQNNNHQVFHLVALESYSPRFRECPHCEELTVTRSEKTIQQPTQYNSGRKLIIDKCNVCNYHRETEQTIPRLPPPSSGSSSGGGGSFGGGSSGGGGSFGGGSSGGGGAGGSW